MFRGRRRDPGAHGLDGYIYIYLYLYVYVFIYIYINIYIYRGGRRDPGAHGLDEQQQQVRVGGALDDALKREQKGLARVARLKGNAWLGQNSFCTRHCFTSRLLCTNQFSLYCPLPAALPALLQYYCTSIAHYTTPPDPGLTPKVLRASPA